MRLGMMRRGRRPASAGNDCRGRDQDRYWAWMSMDTTPALLFTLYMMPVNVIRVSLVITRGITTPTIVILFGVIGRTLSYGVTGLFLAPSYSP